MAKKEKKPVTLRTVSIKIDADDAARAALSALQAAYADACNLLVPTVVETRCWNRYTLHSLAYRRLRTETPLGAQMCCNVLRSVTAAYKALKSNGEIAKNKPVPAINFRRASVHFDKRTFTLKGDSLSLNTLGKRVTVALRPGRHQARLLAWGTPKEAELHCRKGQWFFNLVLEKEIEYRTSGPVLGVDVGENKLAATSTGKIWGGEALRHDRDKHLALRRRLQSNGSKSAKQLLRKVSGREARHMRHVNHVVSKEIVAEAVRIGARAIAMENLTHIRDRIKAGLRVRTRLHRWAFRQLQDFTAYKAAEPGIASVFTDPAYTSKGCSDCGQIGLRVKHRFVCKCGRRAHSDVNSARNHARLGERALSPRGEVNRPNVGEISHALSL
jgi:IS605 OrfB family transposase